MRKRIGMLLISLVIGVLGGCGSAAANTDTKETAKQTGNTAAADETESEFFGDGLNEATVIRIGFQTNNVYKVVDDEKQWVEEEFAKDGIEVEWFEFTNGPAMIEAIATGSIDIGTQLGDTPFINALSNNLSIEGIAVSPYDPKAFNIVINSESQDEIKNVEDLKGKRISCSVGTGGHDFLLQELQAAGLTVDDVELVNLDSTTGAVSALAANEVDAITANDPNASKYVLENDFALLDIGASQKQFLNVAVAYTKFAEENPELVARYVKAAFQINEYIQENTEEVKETISGLTEIPVEALTCYDRFEYKDEFDDDVLQTLENTQAFLLSQGLLENEVDFVNSYTNKYVEEAKRLLEEE